MQKQHFQDVLLFYIHRRIIYWCYSVPKYNKDKSDYRYTSFDWNNEVLVVSNNNTIHIRRSESVWICFTKIRTATWIRTLSANIMGTPKRSYNENHQTPLKKMGLDHNYNCEKPWHMFCKYRNRSSVALQPNQAKEKLTLMIS